MSTHAAKLEAKYGARNYASLPVILTRAEGADVWDEDGKQYLDMLGAYSAVSHGHRHPRLIAALTDQLGKIDVVSRAFMSEPLGGFLECACKMTGMERALPMNTGAEAVETGLKAARKWAYKVKGVADDKAEIIVCDGNFHGRTIAITGFSSVDQYRDGFGPFPPGFVAVPFGDAAALEAAITPNTAAFLVEPIQGEGGVVLPPDGYLAKCAEICRANNVLLICDEIQTGLGRTGRLLASDHEGVKPDGLLLGKALGGGLIPVSLFLARNDVMDVFTPGDHGSTFGGYPLGAAVGHEALKVLDEDNLIERSSVLGQYMLDKLSGLNHPAILEVRGRGLFAGVEFDPKTVSASDVCYRLLDKGVLTKDTARNTTRFAPPLIITEAQIDSAVDALAAVLREL
ncbi:MAG: ornithine--oxo-acid transaminase [Rhodospirillaceae bacterium]|jgi:ornithine--oxo-acid transaminase|nr:ornithine--oxo-acid transaminase [Rhodospirillaceae bacterium]MBT5455359.1 ornithine--oxo-acid transaminase [Rhodospirillaceae bacterium]